MIIMKDDSINRQVAIDAFYEMASDIDHLCTVGDYVHVLEMLPSAQPNWCDGCKWEYAFGYGECHHCKRSYNDMYEVKDEG